MIIQATRNSGCCRHGANEQARACVVSWQELSHFRSRSPLERKEQPLWSSFQSSFVPTLQSGLGIRARFFDIYTATKGSGRRPNGITVIVRSAPLDVRA